jgi:hypothetical protein
VLEGFIASDRLEAEALRIQLGALAVDEDEASAGAQSAPTALLHPWKAAVTLPLSRSMRFDTRPSGAVGDLRSAAHARRSGERQRLRTGDPSSKAGTSTRGTTVVVPGAG